MVKGAGGGTGFVARGRANGDATLAEGVGQSDGQPSARRGHTHRILPGGAINRKRAGDMDDVAAGIASDNDTAWGAGGSGGGLVGHAA